MIDIKALERDELNASMNKNFIQGYRDSIKNRGGDPSLVDELLNLNKERKSLLTETETAKAKQNKVSAEIAKLKRKDEDVSNLLKEMQELSENIKNMQDKSATADEKVSALLSTMPNILHHTTPVGKASSDNRVVRTVGLPTTFSFEPKDHVELGEKLEIIDFNRAGKVSGARFAFLKGLAARLERSLIQFMMDVHSEEHGYEEMIPPFIVNSKSMFGTGQFPKFKEDVFWISNPEYYLIPTAEVPVTNYFSGEILDEAMLPKSFVAYSPCFRSEAGSYGRDTKGLIRQHQFNKVELVKFTRPEQSEEEHEKLTKHAEEILNRLEIPYRTIALCSGDIGFGSMKCYDIEVWLPGQKAYREISSCSNFGDFQARRANIRFRDGPKGKPQFVHTLNGSGLAVGRTLIAIIENYQKEDGSIAIPTVLKKR
ncbi:MAG: serine--tRNA ligase [Bdellovibrionales bacterium RBG_16_40_8]|nr:MAG: serine--tRNA ligase [Bdellovibrionales bacterium RBG_16_40_8]